MATEGGIRQFIDLGGGLPTQTNVHEMAQQVVPDARVVYVDIDPVVWSHGQALLAHGDQVAMVRADLRDPATVMRHPDVLALLDLAQPVAVVCAAVLHFVADEDDPYRIIAEYRDHMAPGSYLAISHGTTGSAEEDPDNIVGGVTSVYRQASAQLHVRSLAGIEGFFDGFDLIEPVWSGSTTGGRARISGPGDSRGHCAAVWAAGSSRRTDGGSGPRWTSAGDRCRPSGAGSARRRSTPRSPPASWPRGPARSASAAGPVRPR